MSPDEWRVNAARSVLLWQEDAPPPADVALLALANRTLSAELEAARADVERVTAERDAARNIKTIKLAWRLVSGDGFYVAIEGGQILLTQETERAFDFGSEAQASAFAPMLTDYVVETKLEYDAALVVSPDEIGEQTPCGIRVLYVALTRPTWRLATIDITDGRPVAWRESLESPLSDSA